MVLCHGRSRRTAGWSHFCRNSCRAPAESKSCSSSGSPATRWPKRHFPPPFMGIIATSHPILPGPSFLGRQRGARTTHELSCHAVFQRAGKRKKCQPEESPHHWVEMLMEEKHEDCKKCLLHSHSLRLLPFSGVEG